MNLLTLEYHQIKTHLALNNLNFRRENKRFNTQVERDIFEDKYLSKSKSLKRRANKLSKLRKYYN